ncbi:MAG: hypothetical protein OXK80_01620 [Bdellovibrionales bacterium]|nr:hypothetical protein [Bdellovibrionales bacterium]
MNTNRKQFDCNTALKLSNLTSSIRIKRVGKEFSGWSALDLLFDNLISVAKLAVIFKLSPTIHHWIFVFFRSCLIEDIFFRSLQKWFIQKEESLWE